MELLNRARELKEETISHRRFFHQTAEVGLELPKAAAYVMQSLGESGLMPQACGEGVMAELGRGGRLLLLRADLDALPMAEESGLDFACTEGRAHACGHDCHGAMLLTAAKLLRERESELKGRVRFLFQTGEESFQGAKDAIEHGILEPRPDAALALHVAAGSAEPGTLLYHDGKTPMLFSVDGFTIAIRGKGGHGAYPHLAVDPIHIGTAIYQALQGMTARETDPNRACVLSVGQFSAGTAANIIPETAILRGTIRTNDQTQRELMTRRLTEISEGTARNFGGRAQVTWDSQVPPLSCRPQLVRELAEYAGELPGLTCLNGATGSASEDFAYIARQIPSAFFYLTAGFSDERGEASAHNPKVQFNEDVLPLGAAVYAYCALRWLEAHPS